MAQLQWNLNFKRLMDSSLDADYSFDTITSLNNYLTNPYRYAGQLAYCVANDTLYILDKTKTVWKEIGKGTGSGIEIIENYSLLPTVTDDTICYVVDDYTDTTVSPSITHKSGFYLWYDDGVNSTEWKLISSDNETIPQWKTDHDYVVGNRVKYNNYVYECIADHHSDLTDFDNDKDNWIIELDKYYNVTKKQYDNMVKNGLITASTKHLYVVEGNSSSGGSGNLTTDLISNVTVGGVSANTKYTKGTSLETIIKDILVKYFPADLVFSLNPSKTLYKIGEAVNSIDLIATATKKSENIENIKYYIDGALVDTKDETTDTGIENGGTYTYTYGTPFSTDTTFKVDVYDGKNTTTKTIKVEFVNPFYCGLASSTLQEILQKKGTYTYNNITCNNDSIVFKYPKSYGTLTSILDSNNFENISAFTRSEEVINSVDYYVYTSAVTTVTNFKFIFKF